MFKSMSLSKKMALGFGSLIVMAGLLGGLTWNGLRRISDTAALSRKGNQCVDILDRCAALRGDFARHGFGQSAGDARNAAEEWRAAQAELGTRLHTLADDPRLDDAKRALVRSAADKTAAYRPLSTSRPTPAPIATRALRRGAKSAKASRRTFRMCWTPSSLRL